MTKKEWQDLANEIEVGSQLFLYMANHKVKEVWIVDVRCSDDPVYNDCEEIDELRAKELEKQGYVIE